jgi:DNA-binding response OmpR family regulator
LTVGSLQVDPGTRQARTGGRAVDCTPAEFEILRALAEQPGMVLSRAQLRERTSHLYRDTTDRTIDVHVRNLRKKLEPDPARPTHLVTVFGVGYKLVDPT